MKKVEKPSAKQHGKSKRIVERVSVKTAFVLILIGGTSLFIVLYLAIVKMVYEPERAIYDRAVIQRALHLRNNAPPKTNTPVNPSEEEKQKLLSISKDAKTLKVMALDRNGMPLDISKEENVCQASTIRIMADGNLTEHTVVNPENIFLILEK